MSRLWVVSESRPHKGSISGFRGVVVAIVRATDEKEAAEKIATIPLGNKLRFEEIRLDNQDCIMVL